MDNSFSALTEREKKVISLRYSNEGEVQQTLSEIATVIHRTRERVRQIVIKCIRKMRKHRETKILLQMEDEGEKSSRFNV